MLNYAGLVVVFTTCTTFTPQNIRLEPPNTGDAATHAALHGQVAFARDEQSVLAELAADCVGVEFQRLDLVDFPQGDIQQQIDKALMSVADDRHAGCVIARMAHVVINGGLPAADDLRPDAAQTILERVRLSVQAPAFSSVAWMLRGPCRYCSIAVLVV